MCFRRCCFVPLLRDVLVRTFETWIWSLDVHDSWSFHVRLEVQMAVVKIQWGRSLQCQSGWSRWNWWCLVFLDREKVSRADGLKCQVGLLPWMQRIWLLGIATGLNWFCRFAVSLESFSFVEACGCRRLCLDLDGSGVVRTSDCTLVTISKNMLDQQLTNISHIFHNFLNFDDFHSTIRWQRRVVESGGPGLWRQRRGGLPGARAHGRAQRGLGDGNHAHVALPSGSGVFGSLFVCFRVCPFMSKIWSGSERSEMRSCPLGALGVSRNPKEIAVFSRWQWNKKPQFEMVKQHVSWNKGWKIESEEKNNVWLFLGPILVFKAVGFLANSCDSTLLASDVLGIPGSGQTCCNSDFELYKNNKTLEIEDQQGQIYDMTDVTDC